jgi:hypothetical protein
LIKQEELIALSEEELELVIGGKDPDADKPFIYVKLLTGDHKRVLFTDGMLVRELREIIANCQGIQIEQVRLTFAGRQLEDGFPLASYGVQRDSTIHLMMRLRG